MASQLGDYSACENVTVPPLVITKINYNPATSTSFPVSNDQEFIEITNTGSTTVNLSGIYFRELGITYQFPYNSTIAGNSSLYLASNATVFQAKYGFAPFGQYTRNLSNKSENLVLADTFGNIIDNVQYFDSAPWPAAPDGNGSYLQLISTALDNNIASSWIASSTPLAVNQFSNNTFSIFPNPTNNLVTISSPIAIQKIEIIDIYGKLIQTLLADSNELQTDVSNLASGIYFLKINNQFGTKIEKLIKN
jgi:hypothetical protein